MKTFYFLYGDLHGKRCWIAKQLLLLIKRFMCIINMLTIEQLTRKKSFIGLRSLRITIKVLIWLIGFSFAIWSGSIMCWIGLVMSQWWKKKIDNDWHFSVLRVLSSSARVTYFWLILVLTGRYGNCSEFFNFFCIQKLKLKGKI